MKDIFIKKEHYTILFTEKTFKLENLKKKVIFEGNINSEIKFLHKKLEEKDLTFNAKLNLINDNEVVSFNQKRPDDIEKTITFTCFDQYVEYGVSFTGKNERIEHLNYFYGKGTNQTEYGKIYSPRFDWFEGKVIRSVNENDRLSCQQWLSPPPFAFVLTGENEKVFLGVAPKVGEYNFTNYNYMGKDKKHLNLNYEGHTLLNGKFEAPKLLIGIIKTKDENDALKEYVDLLKKYGCLEEIKEKKIYDWWKKPIICPWGQMRHDYREDHDGHENGSFINVTHYCTQTIYEGYIKIIDDNNLNPGTLIIDMGWAENPALGTPSKRRWKDMRGFIDQEHSKGRKVLLWYTPVVTDGLPKEACMTLNNRLVVPDPYSPIYQNILKKEIKRMLSSEEGCLNADGFKIDFTQNNPSENDIFTGYINTFWGLINENNEKHLYPKLDKREKLISSYSNQWGVEILKKYIENIYENMKKVKEDSLLITHTCNPYFANYVDILRLNDLDGKCSNVLAVMKNRAALAKLCNNNWLIDTDNDLMFDKSMWKDYIKLQPKLGIPDTYYVSAIATSGETLKEEDYALLRRIWRAYEESL